MGYVVADKPDKCVLCAKRDAADDQASHVLCRGRDVFVLLNTFPYNSGHVMVVPYRHVSNLTDLSCGEVTELMAMAQACIRALGEALRAEGINLGMNIGRAAGAGICDHIHLHVVPRWGGDTNYMTAIAETRVVPQSLADSACQLRPLIQQAVASVLQHS